MLSYYKDNALLGFLYATLFRSYWEIQIQLKSNSKCHYR